MDLKKDYLALNLKVMTIITITVTATIINFNQKLMLILSSLNLLKKFFILKNDALFKITLYI